MTPPPASETPQQTLPAKRDTPPPHNPNPPKRSLASQDPPLQVVLLTPQATPPKRSTPLSAGFDLSASESVNIPPRSRALVKTGLRVAVPVGCYARVAPRSGLAVKKFVDVGAGVIDADYRGEVGVVLFNFGDEEFRVEIGDRIAQLVLEKISTAQAIVVDKLDETERGDGGFGSTGVGKIV